MKRYLIRSLKYFVALCVLCAGIMALNRMMGSALDIRQTLYVMFHTTRGMLLPAVIVVLAALYPKFGFIVRKVGIRRGVARVEYRLDSYIRMRQYDN